MNDLIPKADTSPLITDIRVRKPKANEHPLTFDVKIGDADSDSVKRALKLWEDAVKNAGPHPYHSMTPEQQAIVDEFWKSFDPSCLYEGAKIEGEETITVKFNYERDHKAIVDDIRKLAERDSNALHSPDDV